MRTGCCRPSGRSAGGKQSGPAEIRWPNVGTYLQADQGSRTGASPAAPSRTSPTPSRCAPWISSCRTTGSRNRKLFHASRILRRRRRAMISRTCASPFDHGHDHAGDQPLRRQRIPLCRQVGRGGDKRGRAGHAADGGSEEKVSGGAGVMEAMPDQTSWWEKALSWLPLALAFISTALFALYTWHLAIEVVTIGDITQTRFQHFLAGAPNSMGDTLAGFIGSLTLIWVVASVVQQSMELRAQRREFSAMAKAQDAQVEALKSQTALLEDERLRRNQSVASDYIETLLISLKEVLSDQSYSLAALDFNSEPDSQGHVKYADRWTLLNSLSDKPQDFEKFFLACIAIVDYTINQFRSYRERSHLVNFPERFLDHHKNALRILLSIEETMSTANSVDIERVRRLRIRDLLQYVEEIDAVIMKSMGVVSVDGPK